MILGIKMYQRIEHCRRSRFGGAALRIIGRIHIHTPIAPIQTGIGLVSPVGVGLIVRDYDQIISKSGIDSALTNAFGDILITAVGQFITFFLIVSISFSGSLSGLRCGTPAAPPGGRPAGKGAHTSPGLPPG